MALPTLLIVAFSVFFLIRLIPGDPASLMLGDLADAASLADLRARLGLDQPWPVQFAIWLKHALSGDLGVSISTHQPVLPLVWQRFLISAQIVVAAVFLASLVAVPAGMIAARRQNSAFDVGLVSFITLLLSIPSFWLGLLFLLMKERTTAGHVQVTVNSGGKFHSTMIPVYDPMVVHHIMQQVNYARSVSV